MTRGIEQALGLPSLSDMLHKEPETIIEDEPDFVLPDPNTPIYEVESSAQTLAVMTQEIEAIHGDSHAAAMDTIYEETTRLARDAGDLGFNVDVTKSAGILTAADGFYRTAIAAMKEKREKEMATLKIAIEQQRLDILKAGGRPAVAPGAVGQRGFQADRNEIVAQAIARRKKDGDQS